MRAYLLPLLLVAGSVALFVVGGNSVQYSDPERDRAVRALLADEEFILDKTPRLRALARGVVNLRLPDHRSTDLFGASVSASDLSGAPAAAGSWPVGEPAQVDAADLDIWRPLLDSMAYFEQAKFYFVRADAVGAAEFTSTIVFHGLGRTLAGTWREVRATLSVRWRDGRIVVWRLESLKTLDRSRLMFRETLDRALPEKLDLERARTSVHERHVRRLARTGSHGIPKPYGPHFKIDAASQHPGLSVVDIDGDGWDDLYVTVRWGRNLLLRNRGDGTFEEDAVSRGLGVHGLSSSAIFGDFDNDGDLDLFLGRSMERSMYLVNEGGRFVDRSESLVSVPLPYFVASVSAADYNGDGLLDIYLCTHRLPGPGMVEDKLRGFLTEEQLNELKRRHKAASAKDRYINAPGPPNLLLVNRGGRFEVAPENLQVEIWLNTLQATWADFDGDGDPDLYVSNDFAPDFLMRNDGESGFTDVTKQQGGVAMMGFGMGASWGDYDNDGLQDLYVSNMYSKAGRRITAKFPQLDPRVVRSAEGNYLFRNTGERMQLVSGSEPPGLGVMNAGWSWGGQFIDVNNDGFLDIHVSSGYFTSPAQADTEVDL